MICPITSIITDFLSSTDFRAVAICVSPIIFKDLYLNKQMWEYYQFVLRNHVVDFQADDWNHLLHYQNLITENMQDTEKKFRTQIIQSLWHGLTYELISLIDRYVQHVQPSAENASDSELLNSRFMEMLAMSKGRIHSVSAFAARLFVTPQHLSISVRQTTGKSALKWIHKNMTTVIERELSHSERNIKEIAYELGFPNLSFFGKFVKTHLGDTPANIRKRN